MSLPQPSAELIPSREPEPKLPELRLIQGGGEGAAHEDGTQSELYVVTETGDPDIDNTDETVAESEADAEEDDTVVDIQARGLRVAAVGEYAVSVSKTYHEEDAYKHKGGGGWYLRELIRKAIAKLEAKSHPSDCDCEFHDGH